MCTVDWEILVIKNFRQSNSTTKIEQAKCFLGRINGISLFRRVVIAMKMKPGKNLASKIFFQRKFPIYGIMFDNTLYS